MHVHACCRVRSSVRAATQRAGSLTKRRSAATYVGPALGQLQLSGPNVSLALDRCAPPAEHARTVTLQGKP